MNKNELSTVWFHSREDYIKSILKYDMNNAVNYIFISILYKLYLLCYFNIKNVNK